MAKTKPIINVAFVGHVDHGKSTTIGRLMFDSGAIPQQELDKLKAIAKEHGKAGFEFAYIMDKFKEERERGVTIDLSYQKLITNKFEVTIIDAPGHKDFIKNMITGASQSDAAFLTVAAAEGVQPQTKEHAWLLRTMGVKQVAVIINKMDTVDWKEDAFKKVVADVSAVLKQAGYKVETMAFIPAAGYLGDNVVKRSDKMTLQDVYEITGIGTVPVGKIETGVMKVGQKVVILPGRSGTGVNGEVKTIEMHHEQMSQAEAGDNVGINIRGVGKKDVARGDVVCDAAKPATIAQEFIAQIAVISHPTVIAKGYTPVFHVHTAQVPCQFIELIEKQSPDGTKALNPDFLKNGDVAKVKVRPIGNLVLETNATNPHMARFAIRDAGSTVAAGVCLEITAKK